MTKLTLLFAGFLASSAWAHPAVEDVLNLNEESEHRETVRERVGEQTMEVSVTEQINIQSLHPTVKCAEIVPDAGNPGPENHQACLAHCVQLEMDYRRGRCLKGICHCGGDPNETEKYHQRNEKGHPTVRCEHIIPASGSAGPVNHEACKAHCGSLGREFNRGECLDGVCHCGATEAVQTENFLRHPTVLCEHLVPLKGAPSAESHELCLAHCRNLGSEYVRGDCADGVCHCERDRISPESAEEMQGRPTVKCEHIHPLTGQPGPENHEACSSHCRTIAELYLEGRCVAGMCRCKPGTVVESAGSEPISQHPE